MKRLIALTFIIFTLTSCSFVSDSEVQNNNVSTNNSLETITNTGTTRRIKNIKKARTNSWEILQNTWTVNENILTNNVIQETSSSTWTETQNTENIWTTLSDLEKISIADESIVWTWTDISWIEDVSEEQVSELVDILLETWK